jgi:hypothetical protein
MSDAVELTEVPKPASAGSRAASGFSLALTAFVAWAVLSGHGALTACAFVGFLGLWFAALPISLVALGIRNGGSPVDADQPGPCSPDSPPSAGRRFTGATARLRFSSAVAHAS